MSVVETPAVEDEPLDVDAVAGGFGDLPTLAPVAVEVLQLADDPNASLEDIAEALGRDPALAGQILKVANSSLYGMSGSVSSLDRACSILGLRTVKLLSLSFAVLTGVSDAEENAVIWRRTLAASALAQTIAERLDRRLADEAFIGALLGNLGRFALMEHPCYAEATTSVGGWLTADLERQHFGLTGDDVSAAILGGWGLPDALAEAIRHRHDPSEITGVTARLAALLAAADAASRLIIAEDADAPTALDAWHEATVALGVSDDVADTILEESGDGLAHVSEIFNTDVTATMPVGEILSRAREGMARLSLDVALELSQQQQRADQLASENERLSAEVVTDPLTGLANRRGFARITERAVAAHGRGSMQGLLGLLMVDIDLFKQVNDAYGHDVGDQVLQVVAERLTACCRVNEDVARMGGEEFAVLIEVTGPDDAVLAGERFRKSIADAPIPTAIGALPITVSVGVAVARLVDDSTADWLYQRADKALFGAKRGGRNQVHTSA